MRWVGGRVDWEHWEELETEGWWFAMRIALRVNGKIGFAKWRRGG